MINSIIKNLGIDNEDSSIVTITDNRYKFNVTLFNTNGDMVRINFSAISDFRIVERMTSFYAEGHIVFNNDLNALEGLNSLGNSLDGTTSNNFNSFNFRGDGRDFILVSIQPSIENELPNKVTELSLNYVFSIYDYEELVYENNSKMKKLYFHDYSYFMLKEKNSFFSTGKFSKGVGNEERSMYTGDAIKKLLETTLTDYNLKFKEGRWDKGGSKIFYSSPAQYKAIDDLYYLLDNHVSDASNQYAPSLLLKDRDKWSLIPITEFFKNGYLGESNVGGPLLTEQFIIGRMTAGSPSLEKTRRSPISPFSLDMPDYVTVDNFQFIDPSPTDVVNNFTSHIVHGYDANKKTFSVDITENNIEKNLQVYKQSFVRSQKGSLNSSPTMNIPVNQTFMDKKVVVNKFNPNRDPNARLNSGRNRFLLSSLFLNSSISFKCRGNVARSPGRFFTISRGDNYPDNKFDNKSLGMYLTTAVEHVFASGTYYNNIIGIKTYTHDKSNNTQLSI